MSYYADDPGFIWPFWLIEVVYEFGYEPNVRSPLAYVPSAAQVAQMPTFRGVPPSPAEQFRGQVFARA